MKKRKKTNYKKGFTLIETLVSIYILVLVVVLPISASYIGVSMANQSRDRLIAGYLAQDAIEYIRQQMTTNIQKVPDTNPLHGLNVCTGSSGFGSPKWCGIDTINDNQIVDETKVLQQDPATGGYGYNNGWDDTNITRALKVNGNLPFPAEGIEYQIEVIVEWGKVGSRKTLILKEIVRTWMDFI